MQRTKEPVNLSNAAVRGWVNMFVACQNRELHYFDVASYVLQVGIYATG